MNIMNDYNLDEMEQSLKDTMCQNSQKNGWSEYVYIY